MRVPVGFAQILHPFHCTRFTSKNTHHSRIAMSEQPTTVRIGIETAAKALHNFLAKDDFPADCTVILATLNEELRSLSSPQTLQYVVSCFLDSDLLGAACDAWNHKEVPRNLGDQISTLFVLITVTIFEGSGDLTTGLQYRGNHTKHICRFYHKIYSSALTIDAPKLVEYSNLKISECLARAFVGYPNFVRAFVDYHGELAPCNFFVKHLPILYKEMALLIEAGTQNNELESHVKAYTDTLSSKLHWGKEEALWESQYSWKLLFFCKVFSGTQNCENKIILLERFLHSVESWKVLFEICLYFLNSLQHNSMVDSIIAEVASSRMSLINEDISGLVLDEKTELVIWDFLSKTVECDSFELLFGLFYAPADEDVGSESASFEILQKHAFRLMGTNDWFISSFTTSFPDFCKIVKARRPCMIEFNEEKPFATFLVTRLKKFFTNSLITNKFIYNVIICLLHFDCSETEKIPNQLIKAIIEVMESIPLHQYKRLVSSLVEEEENNTLIDMAPEDGHQSRGSENDEGFETVDMVFKQEGLKQNIYILEGILGTVYAAQKAKQIACKREGHSKEAVSDIL